MSILLVIATILLTVCGRPATLFASCWASNPDGNRVCGEFRSPHGIVMELCEDTPGECVSEGYAPVPKRAHKSHPKAPPPAPSAASPTGATAPGSDATNLEPPGPPAESTNPAPAPDSRATLDPAAPIAVILGVLLAAFGFWFLPENHRGGLARVGGGIALFVLAIVVGVLAASSKSGRRRRRYY